MGFVRMISRLITQKAGATGARYQASSSFRSTAPEPQIADVKTSIRLSRQGVRQHAYCGAAE